MLDLNSLAIIVPARGGSKRVPLKNIRALGGRPLLEYTLVSAIDAKLSRNIVVSTDSDEIFAVAEKFPARVVRRPDALSGDSISTEAAVLHALDALAADGQTFEWVMILPPTSPFRSAETVKRFAETAQNSTEAVANFISVTENRDYFWKAGRGGSMTPADPSLSRRQQERPPLFLENSAIYLCRVNRLRETGIVFSDPVVGIPISAIEAWDINTEEDFSIADGIWEGIARLRTGNAG